MRYDITSIYISIGMSAIVLEALSSPAYMVYITSDFRINAASTATATLAYAMTYALSSPIIAHLAKGFSPRIVSLASLLAFAISTFGAAISFDIDQYIVCKVLSGISAATFAPIAYTVASQRESLDSRATGLAGLSIAVSVSSVIAVPLAIYISEIISWRLATILYGSIALSVVPLSAQMDTVSLHFSEPVAERNLSLPNILRESTLFFPSLVWTVASYTIYNYIPYILMASMTPNQISIIMVSYGVGGVAGSMSANKIVPPFGVYLFVAFAALANSTSLLLLYIIEYSSLIYIVIFFMGFFSWSAFVANQRMLVSLVSWPRTMILSLNNSLIYVGSATGSLLGGFLVVQDRSGESNLLLSSTIYIISIIVLMLVHLRK